MNSKLNMSKRDDSLSKVKKRNKSENYDLQSSSSNDKFFIEARKHIDAFYEKPPPGLVKLDEEKPEDCIPDLPENKQSRDFLAKAPRKGLWMPLGIEVKVMQCWRCKQYGHRTGDRECPLFLRGNPSSEMFRFIHEDPMYNHLEAASSKNNSANSILSSSNLAKNILSLSSSVYSSSTSSSSTSLSSSSTSSSSRYSKSKRKRKRSKSSKSKSHKRKKSHKKNKKGKQRKK